MSLRIAFSGASGTGKSTLAVAIADHYKIEINPVGSRSVSQAMGFASPYDVDKAGQRAVFQRRLLAEKVAWERVHDSFVVDRTTLDNLTYMIMHDSSALDEEMLSETLVGLARYTHVVYCPVDAFQNLDDDPARVKDKAYHAVCDGMVRGFLAKWAAPSTPVLFLGGGSREERFLEVVNFIRGAR